MNRILTVMVAISATVLLLARVPAAQDELANVKELGRAVSQFQDDMFHAVVAYNYSQQQHNSRWILIQLAMTSSRPMTIRRDGIFIRTPDVRVIDLATQRRFREDVQRVTELLQRSSSQRHPVDSYFNLRSEAQGFVFFAGPSEGIVSNDFVVSNDRLMVGDLFFEDPRGLWVSGTYTLTVQSDRAKAELPITLN